MTLRRLAATFALLAASAALDPASAFAATPNGKIPSAFEATCEGLGQVAVMQAGRTSWMVDEHWLVISIRYTFVPDDGSDPVLYDEAYNGRMVGLGEPITCTVDFPEEGGTIQAVATVVPVPPQ
jgi:hypothetical protein